MQQDIPSAANTTLSQDQIKLLIDNATPSQEQIKLLIDNALLTNNLKINTAIEHSADRVAKAVNDSIIPLLGQLTTQAEKIGALESRVTGHDTKLASIWAKMLSVGAACATLGGLIGLFIAQLAGK